MNFSLRSFALFVTVLSLSPAAIEGRLVPQDFEPPRQDIELVERVLAVVGDSAILQTDLDGFVIEMEARGWARPSQPEQLMEARLELLDQLINQQLIVQEAVKDTTLLISEEELEDRVQQEIDGQVRQAGTLGRLQQTLAAQGMTMAVFREQKKSSLRAQLLQERYFAKRGRDLSDIVVTDEEARAYWDDNQDLIPPRPATIRFANMQILPEAAVEAKEEALAEADSLLDLVRDGADFAELADRFSDDTGAEGGELGWLREDGTMVEPFEEMAFRIPPGSISSPVETEFGYHLISVERVRGGERRVRHILISPTVTQEDIEATGARAEAFAERLRAGETIEDLGEQADTVDLTLEQIAQTSQEFAVALQNAEVGDVVGPIQIPDPRREGGYSLARVLGKTAAGTAEFEDFKDVIVQRLQQEGLTESVIEELRSQAYIDIRLGGG